VTGAEDVRHRVAELLETGVLGDAALRESATVAPPIAVAEPSDGRLHSWFVPVAVGDRLAGFAELRPDLELLRYSGFPPSSLPPLAAWADLETVRKRAAGLAREDETLGEPVLTYDGAPSRLAWAVTATDAAGRSRRLFVAGDYAYEG
jgi:hypothetical protein